MPELPEVETIVRGLASRLEGAELGRARLLFPPLLRRPSGRGLAVLEGMRVLGVRRRGKMILVSCEGGWTLAFHLKMTGQLLLAESAVPVDKYTRLVIPLAGRGLELRFRDVRKFGFLCRLGPGPACSAPELDGLGPEPLETCRAAFAGRFRGRTGRIKSLLLDQKIIAGIGNIYADEILHRARLRPDRPASSLDRRRVAGLAGSIVEVLTEAIDAGGSTLGDAQYVDLMGKGGSYQDEHRVYGRGGERCLSCTRGWVRRAVTGGRGTHWCPVCQR